MSRAREARRPRVVLTLVLLALLLSSAHGCGDDDDPDPAPGPVSAPSSEVSSEELAQSFVTETVNEWLSGFEDPAETPLSCPGADTDAIIVSTDESDVRACGYQADDGSFHMLVENLTGTPMSLWGVPGSTTFTIQPSASFDLRVIRPEFGQFFTYQANVPAAMVAVVGDELGDQIRARALGVGFEWGTCLVEPDVDCVVEGVTNFFPRKISIRGRSIPIGAFVKGLNYAFQNRELIEAVSDQVRAVPNGTLTINRESP